MDKVKVGFIGAGGMAEHHMKTVKKLEHAELTAVYDINEERAKYIADTYGAETYDSATQLLDSGKVDAVFICTPPFARDTLEEDAAARGIHILSEKPVALDMATAQRKSKAISDAGIINSSGYCLRYLDTVHKARAYLKGKQINMVVAFRIGGLPPVKWFAQQHLSGGQIVEQATHQVDLVRYLAGEFDQVQSIYAQRSIRTIDPDATIPDVGVVSFTLRSGAIGSFMNSPVSRHRGRGEVEIYGPDYFLSIDGHKLSIFDDEQKLTETCDTDFYLEQNRAFIEAVRTGNQNLVLGSYAEAVATLEATLSFNESADRRIPIALS